MSCPWDLCYQPHKEEPRNDVAQKCLATNIIPMTQSQVCATRFPCFARSRPLQLKQAASPRGPEWLAVTPASKGP